MGVPNSEVGYTSAMPRREDHEVHKRTCGGIGKEQQLYQGKRETVWFIAWFVARFNWTNRFRLQGKADGTHQCVLLCFLWRNFTGGEEFTSNFER